MAYDSQRAATVKLLTAFGKTVALTRTNEGGVYDPITGTTSAGSNTTLNGVGVLLGYKNSEIGRGDVLSTDKKLLFSGDPLLIGDTYNNFRVYAINELDPDESGTILTTAQLRL